MSDDFVLCWVTGFKDVFSCVLKIELQSTRVHVYAIKKEFLKDEIPGWCRTLMDSGKLVLVS